MPTLQEALAKADIEISAENAIRKHADLSVKCLLWSVALLAISLWALLSIHQDGEPALNLIKAIGGSFLFSFSVIAFQEFRQHLRVVARGFRNLR